MRAIAILVFALAAGGCDKLFSVDAVGSSDAHTLDTIPANCRTSGVMLSADTYLIDETARGARDTLIGDASQPILLKFMLDQAMITAAEHVDSLSISASLVTSAAECTSINVCGPCPPPTAQRVSLYWATTNWSQNDATATIRNAASPGPDLWQLPLARGDMDRSQVVSTGTIGSGTDLTFTVTAADLAANPFTSWLAGGIRLAVELQPDGALPLRASDDTACNGALPARMTVVVCPNP